jgi:hypothetical protein
MMALSGGLIYCSHTSVISAQLMKQSSWPSAGSTKQSITSVGGQGRFFSATNRCYTILLEACIGTNLFAFSR